MKKIIYPALLLFTLIGCNNKEAEEIKPSSKKISLRHELTANKENEYRIEYAENSNGCLYAVTDCSSSGADSCKTKSKDSYAPEVELIMYSGSTFDIAVGYLLCHPLVKGEANLIVKINDEIVYDETGTDLKLTITLP